MNFSIMNSSNIIVEIKHLLNENKGIYLLGLNVMEIWNVCNSREEVAEVTDKYFDILVNILEQQNKEKFPKRGIVFFLPQLEQSAKWLV